MDIFAAVIGEFGRRVGLPSLAPGRNGLVELAIDGVGRLQAEARDGHVLVTLARPWPAYGRRAAAALDMCHWRENHPWNIHAGAKGGEWLTFTARIPVNEFDLPVLERLVGYLSGMQDAAERAG